MTWLAFPPPPRSLGGERNLYVERPGGHIPLIDWFMAAEQVHGIRRMSECVRLTETGEVYGRGPGSPGDLYMQAPRSLCDRLRAVPSRWVPAFHFAGGRARFAAHATPRRWYLGVLRNAHALALLLEARVVDEHGEDLANGP